MNVPKLRFPGFEGEWEEKRLGSVSDVRDGTHDSPKYVSNGFPFITSKNLLPSGEIDFSAVNYISQKDYDNFNKRSNVEVGDILFGMIGTIGNAVIVKQTGFAIKNVALVKQNALLLNSFLLNYLFSPILVKRITDSQVGGTQQFVSLSTIRNLIVSLPSLAEQQKIASFLSSVDNVIQLLTKKKTLLENYKKGIMQKIFSQEIRFKDENGIDFPEWEEKRLNTVLYEHNSKSSGKEDVHSVSVHKGVINQVEHLGRSFAAKNTENYNLVRPNDIIYTKSPTGDFPFGIIKQNKLRYDVIVSPLYGVFCPESPSLGYILDSYFSSPVNAHNYLHSIIQKGAKNTINITNERFLSNSLYLPVSLPEQQKIADFLSGIDRTIDIVNSQMEKAKEYKKGLLQKMFV